MDNNNMNSVNNTSVNYGPGVDYYRDMELLKQGYRFDPYTGRPLEMPQYVSQAQNVSPQYASQPQNMAPQQPMPTYAAQPGAVPQQPMPTYAAQPGAVPQQPMPTYAAQPGAAPQQPMPVYAPKPKTKSDFELKLGRNFMGILASLLIFAGIIVLATAVSQYFTDAIKMGLIFTASVVLFAVGMIGKHFKEKNVFFLSLAGCGIGAIFISLFLAYGYFELINLTFMFVGLGLWSLALSFLGGKDSMLFRLIGQIGLLCSLIFSMIQFYRAADTDNLLVLSVIMLIMYIGISLFYLYLDRKATGLYNLFALIIELISSFILYITLGYVFESMDLWLALVCETLIHAFIIGLVYIFAVRIVDKDKQENVASDYLLGWIVYMLFGAIVGAIATFAYSYNDETHISAILGIIFLGALMYIGERKCRDMIGKYVIVLTAGLLIGLETLLFGVFSEVVGIGIVVIIAYAVSLIFNKKEYFVLGMVCACLYACFPNFDYSAVYLILNIVFSLVAVLIMVVRKDIYCPVFKAVLYFYVMIFVAFSFIAFSVNHTMDGLLCFKICMYVISLVTLLCSYGPFIRNWHKYEEKDNTLQIILIVILNILLLINWISVFVIYDGVVQFIDALFVTALSVGDAWYLHGSSKSKTEAAVFFCIKITMSAALITASYEAPGFIISLACLLVALAAIAYGFIFRRKAARLYGLILSIVCSIKLVLVDIEFDSTIARAVALLICGIIAFAICFIYSVMDKKLQEEKIGE